MVQRTIGIFIAERMPEEAVVSHIETCQSHLLRLVPQRRHTVTLNVVNR